MKFLILLFVLTFNVFGYSHKKGPMVIGDKKKPEASAILEVASTAKGFLPPRMTTIQRDAIPTPTAGLEIFNTDSAGPEFFNGVTWVGSGGTGTSFQITTVGHGRPIGCPLAPVYFNGTIWADASANATATLATHVITAVIDADTLEISQSGRFSCNAHGLTAGSHYYTGVAGGLNSSPAPAYNNPVLLVENANTAHIMPYRASSTAAATLGQVDTVFGRLGNVVSQAGDYAANLITNTPSGTITSTDVQTAINELDADIQAIDFSGKVDSTRNILTGEGLQGGGDLSADRSISLDVNGLTTQAVGLSDIIPFFDGVNHRKTTATQLLSLFTTDFNSLTDVDTSGAALGNIMEYDGSNWIVGNKTIDTDDQNASEVPFAPFSFYTSTDVQTIIPEIETSLRTDINAKAEESRQIIAGTHLTGGGDLSADRTLNVDPSTIDITTLSGFNTNSFIDMSTINIDVAANADGIHITNLNSDGSLDEDVRLAIDIPSLDPETPALPSSFLMGFSVSTNKLVKVSVQDVVDTAAGAIVAPVDEVNGQVGIVALDTDDIPTTLTNVYVTPAEKTQITTNATDIGNLQTQQGTNTTNIGNNTSAISVNTGNITSNDTDIATNATDIGTINTTLGTISTVGFSNDYNDLTNLPTLGTAAATAITDYATAAQGLLANSALQSGDNISELVNDANYITSAGIPVISVNGTTGNVVLDADDIDDATTSHKFATAAQLTQIATNVSDIATANGNISTNSTNISSNDTDIAANLSSIGVNSGNISSNDTDIATNVTNIGTNVTNISSNDTDIAAINTAQGVQDTNITANANAITALATVASSGDYNDLSNLPTLGTAADNAETDFATAVQGLLADSALQNGDNVSELVNDANYITTGGAPVQSVNGNTGIVVLNADDIDDTSTTHKFATATQLTQIATNQSDIATNSTDIGTNATAIASNTTSIATNNGVIATNTANITSNDTDIATNVTNIGTNATNISSNDTDIATNVTNIGTNVTNITSNDVDIAANVAAIALKYDASNPNGYETPAQLDARDTANRARSNHTGTQLAATISDFDAAVTTYLDRNLDQSAVQQTTTAGPVDRFNVTYNLLHSATYRILVNYNWAYDLATNDIIVELLVNGVVVNTHRQEPKDVGGTNGAAGTNQEHYTTIMHTFSATAGNNTFQLRFSSGNATDIATINSHNLTVERY